MNFKITAGTKSWLDEVYRYKLQQKMLVKSTILQFSILYMFIQCIFAIYVEL